MEKMALRQSLIAHEVQLNQAAESLFADHRFTPHDQQRVIEIAARSVAELGFDDGGTYEQLVTRARELGLVECPLELGPHLRMQFLDQPEGAPGLPRTRHQAPPGSITIASTPLDDQDETPKGFYLRRINGALWLRGYWSWAGHIWNPQDVLVFTRDSKAAGE
jgi:hypothetical protein